MERGVSKAVLGLLILAVFISAVSAKSGSIWTTLGDCGDISQDVNHYDLGDKVYINGANFDAEAYDWTITGLGGSENAKASCEPGTAAASGTYSVDDSRTFCFLAYTVENDDCGEYKTEFGNKKDNYGISVAAVIPEFSTIVGMLTILSAVGIFFLVRRK